MNNIGLTAEEVECHAKKMMTYSDAQFNKQVSRYNYGDLIWLYDVNKYKLPVMYTGLNAAFFSMFNMTQIVDGKQILGMLDTYHAVRRVTKNEKKKLKNQALSFLTFIDPTFEEHHY